MPSSRAKTYLLLFLAMSASVLLNILWLQSRPDAAQLAGSANKALRVAAVQPAKSVDQVADTVRAIQRELRQLHLYPGQVDGRPTLVLHAAIVAYEQAQTLPITGEPSQALLQDLIVGPSARAVSGGASTLGVMPGSAAERLVLDLRQKLVSLGYAAGQGDGRLTGDLMQAIRAFERDHNMPQSGRISAHLVVQIQRSAAAFKARSG